MTTEEMIKVMQAFVEGKPIECRCLTEDRAIWVKVNLPFWNWHDYEYRIKPTPMPELRNGMFVKVGEELGVVIKAGYETPRVVYQDGGFDWLEDTDFEKGIKEEISKIYDAHAFCYCIKENVIWEKNKRMIMTDAQRELIESMNEFCREKCPLDATKEEASGYITKNIAEYKLAMEVESEKFGY